MSILDKIDRVLFGATAAEAVEMRIRLAEQRIEQRLIAALEQDEEGEQPEEHEQPAGGGGRRE